MDHFASVASRSCLPLDPSVEVVVHLFFSNLTTRSNPNVQTIHSQNRRFLSEVIFLKKVFFNLEGSVDSNGQPLASFVGNKKGLEHPRRQLDKSLLCPPLIATPKR